MRSRTHSIGALGQRVELLALQLGLAMQLAGEGTAACSAVPFCLFVIQRASVSVGSWRISIAILSVQDLTT